MFSKLTYWCFLFLVLFGCGGGDPIAAIPFRDGGLSGRDGSTRSDGSTTTDGSTRADSGGTPSLCSFDTSNDVFELITDALSVAERLVSVAPGTNGFALAWYDTSKSPRAVRAKWIPTTGAPPDTTDVAKDASFIVSNPAVVLTGTQFLAAWTDNRHLNFEVQAQTLNTDLASTGSVKRVTNDADSDDEVSLVPVGDRMLAAWVRSALAGSRALWIQELDSDGDPVSSALSLSAARSPSRPALATFGTGALVAWTEPPMSGSGFNAVLQRLNSNGTAADGALTLTGDPNASGAVDVAATTSGGAAVFGVSLSGRREVRFRRIRMDGTLDPQERIVTTAPVTGWDASVAAFAGGYIVSYRGRRTASDPIMLWIALLDDVGEVLAQTSTVAVAETGGRTTIRVASDGRILVAWADKRESDTALRALRIRCGT